MTPASTGDAGKTAMCCRGVGCCCAAGVMRSCGALVQSIHIGMRHSLQRHMPLRQASAALAERCAEHTPAAMQLHGCLQAPPGRAHALLLPLACCSCSSLVGSLCSINPTSWPDASAAWPGADAPELRTTCAACPANDHGRHGRITRRLAMAAAHMRSCGAWYYRLPACPPAALRHPSCHAA